MSNGTPEILIDALLEKGVTDLAIIANDSGTPDTGIGRLVKDGAVSKLIASHIGLNPLTGQLMNEGKMEVVLVPQGKLAEQIRAGRAGLGGVGRQIIAGENCKLKLVIVPAVFCVTGSCRMPQTRLSVSTGFRCLRICSVFQKVSENRDSSHPNSWLGTLHLDTDGECIRHDIVDQSWISLYVIVYSRS